MSGHIPGDHNTRFVLNDDDYRFDKNFSNIKDDISELEIDMDDLTTGFYDRIDIYSSTQVKILKSKISKMSCELSSLKNKCDELEKNYKNSTNINYTQLMETLSKLNEINNGCNNLKKRIKVERKLLRDSLCVIL